MTDSRVQSPSQPTIDAADEVHAQPAGADAAQPRIIAMMNQKGGVGKTTSTVNVGIALQRQGHRVLLIDLDPQGHLTLHVGVELGDDDKTNYELFTDEQTTAGEVVQQIGDDLGVLPAEVQLAGVETELSEQVATGQPQRVLAEKTHDLVQQFDYVLLDCPPSLGMLTVNALAMADEVIVPMQAHFLALQGLSKLLETVQMVNASLNPALQVAGMVLCMHEGQTILAGEVSRDLREFLDSARDTDLPWSQAVLFEPFVRRNIKLAESPSFGQSIFDYAPDSAGARDYNALARAIAAHRLARA